MNGNPRNDTRKSPRKTPATSPAVRPRLAAVARALRAAPARLALLLVVAAPAVAAWNGVLRFAHDVLALDGLWAVSVPLSMGGAGLYYCLLSYRAVLAGDSGLSTALLVWVYAGAEASANWYEARGTRHEAAALYFAGASLSAALVWHVTLRRAFRDQLRKMGRLEAPLPRFRVLRWAVAPRETRRAWVTAVREGLSTPADALSVARQRYGRVDQAVTVVDAVPPSEWHTLSKVDAIRRAVIELATYDVAKVRTFLAGVGVTVNRSYASEVIAAFRGELEAANAGASDALTSGMVRLKAVEAGDPS